MLNETQNTKILLVEDDKNLGELLQTFLQAKGYEATLCQDGLLAWKTYQEHFFDFCILDVMLPKMDGFTLAEKIRKEDKSTPILFLTAKSMKEDTIQGFQIGADDYMTKPFRMEELLLRIQAILRRTNRTTQMGERTTFNLGNFVFEYDLQKILLDETEQKLTSKEAELLKMLCESKNQVLERSRILKKIWLDDTYFNSRSMDVYITKLRKYLKADENVQIINIHGQGFKLIELH